jgi:CIC family chloride channel protein
MTMAPFTFSRARMLGLLRRIVRNDHLVLAVLALVVGTLSGGASVLFIEGIAFFQTLFYGSGTERLTLHAATLPWWHILLVTTLGGLTIGLFVRFLLPGARPHGVADVIEASALRGGAMSSRVGLAAAVASAVSLGAGASVGREGPAIHLGASLAGWIARRLHLTRSLARAVLGCGVAAAVAASFNAPIAGALFANEVIVGHYALKAFAPVVIASVAGTVVSRVWFGDFPAFAVPERALASFWEFPAFVGLGVASGIVAIVFMHSIFVAETAAKKLPVPGWTRPALGGFLLGLLAIPFPQVLGVGYGITEMALQIAYPFWLFIALCAAKLIATAISHGFGFVGGVFSPSLVVGALLGSAYGIVATGIFPEYSSGADAYTLVGMGAVAAAVLGAPISTTLIVFEMTGDYALTLGVMVAVVIACALSQQFYGRSYFDLQLKRRGLDLQGGLEGEILRALKVADVMSTASARIGLDADLQDLRTALQATPIGQLFVVRENGELFGTVTLADLSDSAFDHGFDLLIKTADVARLHPPVLTPEDSLDRALTLMRNAGEEHIAVVRDPRSMTFLGCVHERDVMAAYNRALLQTRQDE